MFFSSVTLACVVGTGARSHACVTFKTSQLTERARSCVAFPYLCARVSTAGQWRDRKRWFSFLKASNQTFVSLGQIINGAKINRTWRNVLYFCAATKRFS